MTSGSVIPLVLRTMRPLGPAAASSAIISRRCDRRVMGATARRRNSVGGLDPVRKLNSSLRSAPMSSSAVRIPRSSKNRAVREL